MPNANTLVTRGGVTYQIPDPTLRADQEGHVLRIGGARYFFTERAPVGSSANDALPLTPARPGTASQPWARASISNDERSHAQRSARVVGRARLVSHEELQRMWSTLDLEDRDDGRVAALFVLLCEGLRKHEIVRVNRADLSERGGILQLRVQASHHAREARTLSIESHTKISVLQRYLSIEHRDTRDLEAPLFWTLGRHGTCQRVRMTSHAISYWVSQLQRRAHIERRLSPHAFRRAWLADGIAESDSLELTRGRRG